jgi:hypothetical protein
MMRKTALKRTAWKRKPSLSTKTVKPLKRAKSRVTKLPKPRIWSTDKADAEFSMLIRDGKCMFPGCHITEIKKLQCSHYHGRAHSATRYHEDNCIALCWFHHFKSKLLGFEYQKQRIEKHGYDGQYTLFMKNWLGIERFDALDALARKTIKRSDVIIHLMNKLIHT